MQKFKQGLELWGIQLRSNGGGTVTDSNKLGIFQHSNTTDRTYTLQDANGTLAFINQSFYIGTTQIAINQTTGTITSLSGVAVGLLDAQNTTTNFTYYPLFATSQGTSVALKTNVSFLYNPNSKLLTSGSIRLTNTTDSASVGSGALIVDGGGSFATRLWVGGNIVRYAGAANSYIYVRSNSGYTRGLFFSTDGYEKWLIACNNATQSGSDVGSDFAICAYNDTGVYIDAPFSITRKLSGSITLARPVNLTYQVIASGDYITLGSPQSSDDPQKYLRIVGGAGTDLAPVFELYRTGNRVGSISVQNSKLKFVISNGPLRTDTEWAEAPGVTFNSNGDIIASSINSITGLSDSNPLANGTAASGTSNLCARADHVHPSSGSGGGYTRIAIADTNYTINSTDNVIVTVTSLSAARTITLPSATTTGQQIQIFDECGSSGVYNISIVRAGTDTINNGSTTILLNQSFKNCILVCTSSGKWELVNFVTINASNNIKLSTGIASAYITETGTNGGTLTPNAGLYNSFIYTMPASGTAITIANPTNSIQQGQTINIIIIQGSSVTTTITWGSNYKFAGGVKNISTTVNGKTVISAIYDGTYWLCTSGAKDFS